MSLLGHVYLLNPAFCCANLKSPSKIHPEVNIQFKPQFNHRLPHHYIVVKSHSTYFLVENWKLVADPTLSSTGIRGLLFSRTAGWVQEQRHHHPGKSKQNFLFPLLHRVRIQIRWFVVTRFVRRDASRLPGSPGSCLLGDPRTSGQSYVRHALASVLPTCGISLCRGCQYIEVGA